MSAAAHPPQGSGPPPLPPLPPLPQPSRPSNRSKQNRGCGCLSGCYGLVLALIFAIQLALLLWIDPPWLEGLAFWRAPLLPPEVVWSADENATSAYASAEAEWEEERAPKPTLLESAAVTLDYQPELGGELMTREGAKVYFPPHSIAEAAKVTLTPIGGWPSGLLPEQGIPVSTGYQIMVGEQDHYDFAQPVRIELPFDRESMDPTGPNDLGIATGRLDQGWRRWRTEVDWERGLLHAEIEQSSWWLAFQWGVRAIVIASSATAGGYQLSPTVRSAINRASTDLGLTYETARFRIHYINQGASSIHLDSGPTMNRFPLAPKNAVQGVPNMIVLAGEVLERSGDRLDRLEYKLPSSGLTDVFFIDIGAYGLTPPGGPMWLNNSWQEANRFPPNLDQNFRGVLLHELIHVAQGHYYYTWNARSSAWWIEMTAPYLAEKIWEEMGEPTDQIRSTIMINDTGRMLWEPIDIANPEINYTYGTFLKYLEPRCDVSDLIMTGNKNGSVDRDFLDSQLRQRTEKSLGQLLHEFAFVYYHDNLWDGLTIPFEAFDGDRMKQLQRQSAASPSFCTPMGLGIGAGALPADIRSFVKSENLGKLKPLTSKLYPIYMPGLPVSRPAKLVLNYTAPSGTSNVKIAYALSKSGRGLPARGERGAFTEATSHHNWVRLLDLSGSSAQVDLVSLVATNPMLNSDHEAGSLERYLLLAPAYVNSKRGTEPNSWEINWHEAELEQFKEKFGGYNLYRRKLGEGNHTFVKVAEKLRGTSRTEQAPDGEDYLYSVSLLDQAGNESYMARVEGTDPFQGSWYGKLRMREGEVVAPVMNALRKLFGKDGQNSPFLTEAEHWLRQVAVILRFGVPMRFEIMRERGEYRFQVKEILFQNLDGEEGKPIQAKRTGTQTLTVRDEDVSLALTLRRKDQIAGELRQTTKEGSYLWEWEFERENPPEETSISTGAER